MEHAKRLFVRDVMKTDFATVGSQASVHEALRRMHHQNTSTLVVERRSEDDEYGMILISDIANEVLARDRSAERVNVYEVMRKPVVSVTPDMDIRYCSRLFSKFKLTRVLVVENDAVVGTVSPRALVLNGLFKLDQE